MTPLHQQSVQNMLQQLGDFVTSSLALASDSLATATTNFAAYGREEQVAGAKPGEFLSNKFFYKGCCTWPGCETHCHNKMAFLQHITTVHVLTNKRTATDLKLQAEIIEQLLTRLIKECDKLEAMKCHLAWTSVCGENRSNSQTQSYDEPSEAVKTTSLVSKDFELKKMPPQIMQEQKPVESCMESCDHCSHSKEGNYDYDWMKTRVLKRRQRKRKEKQLSLSRRHISKAKRSSIPVLTSVSPLSTTPTVLYTAVPSFASATIDMSSSTSVLLSPSSVIKELRKQPLSEVCCTCAATAFGYQNSVIQKDIIQEEPHSSKVCTRESVIKSVVTTAGNRSTVKKSKIAAEKTVSDHNGARFEQSADPCCKFNGFLSLSKYKPYNMLSLAHKLCN